MGIEQTQKGVQPRGCRQGRVGIAVEQVLSHCHRRPQPADRIHVGRRQAGGSRTQGIDFQETPARLVVKGIEYQGGLAGSRNPRDHGQTGADIERNILQVMFAGASNGDGHAALLVKRKS